MKLYSALVIVFFAPALASCVATDGPQAPLGAAVAHNIAVQVVDPDPVYAGDLIEGGSGKRVADAVERHNKGDVKQPGSAGSVAAFSGGAAAPPK
jgi:hypothetical protein